MCGNSAVIWATVVFREGLINSNTNIPNCLIYKNEKYIIMKG
jgi:hypothetical protein